jgi:hypothetical protein
MWQIGVANVFGLDASTLGPPWALCGRTIVRNRATCLGVKQEGGLEMAKQSQSPKPSKAALSKAGRTLASNASSKPAKSKAGSTLGKG